MRVASRIAFGERKSGIRDPRRRYFLAFEGKITEHRYFKGLIGKIQRESLSFPLVEVILFARKDEHNGHSNPSQVVNYTIETVQAGSFPLDITYQELFEDYVFKVVGDSINRNGRNLAYSRAQRFLGRSRIQMQSKVSREFLEPFLEKIQEVLLLPLKSQDGLNIIKEVLDSYKFEDLSYREDDDSVCIIVDRDTQSFTSEQYDEVVQKCKTENFQLFVTNPCFEFFLLLHKTDASEYPVEEILRNRKIGKTTYIEKKLKEHVSHYDKSKFSFSEFESYISTALQNCEIYAQSLEEIKMSIGTNLHKLIVELLGK
ncbi:MAG: RloB family protein [Sphaerochaetaceae bacterium]|nr:RloB family protein [uncultured Sphaerochaeta sp.]MDC7230722.1 RloB family protein [Sphaerochaetaceae bacterium]